MSFLEIIEIIFIVIIILIGLVLIGDFISSILELIKSITKKNTSKANLYDKKIEEIDHSIANPDYRARLQYSTDTLNMIITCINIKVSNKIRAIRTLKTEYKILDLDNDIENIGNDVFKSFKEDFFDNEIILFSTEYLMSFIAENTAHILLDAVIEYNEEFHLMQRDNLQS